jgi:hypothetical protein
VTQNQVLQDLLVQEDHQDLKVLKVQIMEFQVQEDQLDYKAL